MAATVYIRIKLEWEYVHRTVTLSMASYVHKALHRFQHILRGGKKYSPHTCYTIQYGKKVQYADPLDAAEYLSDKETNLVKQVCGTFLYYAIFIDNTILPALSDISSEGRVVTRVNYNGNKIVNTKNSSIGLWKLLGGTISCTEF